MSLLEELVQEGSFLSERFNEPNMSAIIDKYCDYIIDNMSDEDIANKYVLEADKERFFNGETKKLNSGHVYSGLIYDPDLQNKFVYWYKDNYLTSEDINDHYNDIGDCIRKNFDYRMSTYVINTLLLNGINTMTDVDSVKEAFNNIDEKYDNWKKEHSENEFPMMTREFEKANVRTCYKIARDFDAMQILEYISKDLDFKYQKDVVADFVVNDDNNHDRSLLLYANNNKDMVEALQHILQRVLSAYENELGYDKEMLEEILDSPYIGLNDYEFKTKHHDKWYDDNEMKNVVYGYIYDSEDNAMHTEAIVFEGTYKNMANFIMYNQHNPVVITDDLDNLIVSSTMGGYLDRVSDPETRQSILEEILPLQHGEIEPYDVENIPAMVRLEQEVDDILADEAINELKKDKAKSL